MKYGYGILSMASVASAISWTQSGGSTFRGNVWPPTMYDASSTSMSASSEPASSLSEYLGEIFSSDSVDSSSLAPLTTVSTLVYTFPITDSGKNIIPHLTVNSNYDVIVSSGHCEIAQLSNPDAAGASWSVPDFTVTGSTGCQSVDIALDENDNTYSLQYSETTGSQLISYDRNGEVRMTVNFTSHSSLPTTRQVAPMLVASSGIYVPMTTGVNLVDPAGRKPTEHYALGSMSTQVLGNSLIYNSNVDAPDNYCAVVSPPRMDAEEVGQPRQLQTKPLVTCINEGGGWVWDSDAVGHATIPNPNPVFVPTTNNMYFTTIVPPTVYCASALDGSLCPGFGEGVGLPVPGSDEVLYVFAGAHLYSESNPAPPARVTPGGSVSRLLFSYTLAEGTGCIVAVDPSNGKVLDSHCLPALSGNAKVATGVVVILSTRGPGLADAVVALSDGTLVIYDPLSISEGPISRAAPGDQLDGKTLGLVAPLSLAVEEVAVSSSGSPLLSVRDADGHVAVVAFLGIGALPVFRPSRKHISGGAIAAIVLLVAFAVAAASWVFVVGPAQALLIIQSWNIIGKVRQTVSKALRTVGLTTLADKVLPYAPIRAEGVKGSSLGYSDPMLARSYGSTF